jgi:hypothetical protein
MNQKRGRGGRSGGGGRRQFNGGGSSGSSGGGGGNANRNLDSNGPDVKVRGTANHIFDRYCQLARDANSIGDRIAAENYLQHAEHYFRIMLTNTGQNPKPGQPALSSGEAQFNNRDEDDSGEPGEQGGQQSQEVNT